VGGLLEHRLPQGQRRPDRPRGVVLAGPVQTEDGHDGVPMYFTTPPSASTAARAAAKYRLSSCCMSSGSSRLVTRVLSTRSAKSTVTCLRCSPVALATSRSRCAVSGARAVSTTRSPSAPRCPSSAATASSSDRTSAG
jgi:hypothetical protein